MGRSTGEKPVRHETLGLQYHQTQWAVLQLHSPLERNRELWGLQTVCPVQMSEIPLFKGGKNKKSKIFMQSLQVLNIDLIFFNILCRLNEICPILPVCLVCHYCLVVALNPFNTLHFLDKDLIINTIIFFTGWVAQLVKALS